MAHYGMNLYVNWMREKHEKVLEQILKIERCEAEITIELLLWTLQSQTLIYHINIEMSSVREIDTENCICYFF